MVRKIGFVSIFLIFIILFAMLSVFKDSQTTFNELITSDTPVQKLDTTEPPIGIFYDGRYSEPWNLNAVQLTTFLNQTLRDYNLAVIILNASELRSFMENNSNGIVIITMGVAPETIWNGSENSFVETWLDDGGIMIWTGCEEFYWMGTSTGENIPIGHIGSTYVMDMDYLITLSNQIVIPTQMGSDLFINFSSHTTDVFCSISSLMAANVHFEVYARNGDYADPILFQPRAGKGYFVRIHADWNDQLPTNNLSEWISSFIYNRFFNLPVVTEINSPESIFFLTSEPLIINVTNFSEKFGNLYINSTSAGFLPINASVIISPHEEKRINLTIEPLSTARFQEFGISLNIFSNFTTPTNESKLMLLFSKILYIFIHSPLTIDIFDVSEVMYPGNVYTLTCSIQKNINETITIDLILISDGAINEMVITLELKENTTTHPIMFSIQIMANSGDYEIHLRIYQNNKLYSSSSVSIHVQSLFNNPNFLLFIFLLSGITIACIGLFLYVRNKRMAQDPDIISYLETKEKIFLKTISTDLEINMDLLYKRINSCLKRGKIDGYLIRNEKKEFLYMKKDSLQNFVLNTISQMKTTDLFEISRILNISPSELELILSSQLEKPKKL